MLDINSEADKSLAKTGYEIVFHHPKEKTPLPCVSFYNLSEQGSFSADNAEAIQTGRVQIDIWAKKPQECGKMAIKINEIMVNDGWTRELSMDLPDDSEVYRRTMRFSKIFNL